MAKKKSVAKKTVSKKVITKSASKFEFPKLPDVCKYIEGQSYLHVEGEEALVINKCLSMIAKSQK